MTITQMFNHLSANYKYATAEKVDNYYLVRVWEDVPHLIPQGWVSFQGKYDAWAKLRTLPSWWSTETPYSLHNSIGV